MRHSSIYSKVYFITEIKLEKGRMREKEIKIQCKYRKQCFGTKRPRSHGKKMAHDAATDQRICPKLRTIKEV